MMSYLKPMDRATKNSLIAKLNLHFIIEQIIIVKMEQPVSDIIKITLSITLVLSNLIGY